MEAGFARYFTLLVLRLGQLMQPPSTGRVDIIVGLFNLALLISLGL